MLQLFRIFVSVKIWQVIFEEKNKGMNEKWRKRKHKINTGSSGMMSHKIDKVIVESLW